MKVASMCLRAWRTRDPETRKRLHNRVCYLNYRRSFGYPPLLARLAVHRMQLGAKWRAWLLTVLT